MKVYREAAFAERFASAFSAKEIQSDPDSKMYGVHFEEPEWRATFTPIAGLQHDCLVEAVFPMVDGKVQVSVTSEELALVLSKGFKDPSIAARFSKGDANRMRLRVTGDRLHWDTEQLKRHLQALGLEGGTLAELRSWAYLIVDAPEPLYSPFYFNATTEDLIYEDEGKWPHAPVLLDKTGVERKR